MIGLNDPGMKCKAKGIQNSQDSSNPNKGADTTQCANVNLYTMSCLTTPFFQTSKSP